MGSMVKNEIKLPINNNTIVLSKLLLPMGEFVGSLYAKVAPSAIVTNSHKLMSRGEVRTRSNISGRLKNGKN
ncbi:18099_t:CDS:1, partial [Acaulospora morrowiae]